MSMGSKMVSTAPLRAGSPGARERQGRSGLGLRSPHALVGGLCAGLIALGFVPSIDFDLTASAGLGYALGIVGLAAMTLLLGYSVRKRVKMLRDAGPMRRWFEIHLVLGLLGPTAILYHADFEFGSMNSTISLLCVLLVSGSGVGGRFLYGRMHRSLAGPRRTTDAYRRHATQGMRRLEDVLVRTPAAEERLRAFESLANQACSPLIMPLRFFALRPQACRTKRAVLREIERAAGRQALSPALRQTVSDVLKDLCQGFELQVFERLFALWHAIHIPLTVLLFVSAVIHVVAVHLF